MINKERIRHVIDVLIGVVLAFVLAWVFDSMCNRRMVNKPKSNSSVQKIDDEHKTKDEPIIPEEMNK